MNKQINQLLDQWTEFLKGGFPQNGISANSLKQSYFTPHDHPMPSFHIGDLKVDLPIVQGGMGVSVSLSGLASAVANQGGVGIIAANGIGLLEKDYYKNSQEASRRALKKEIQKARAASSGILGVNIMVALYNYHDLMDAAIEEGIDILFLGAGLPIKGIPLEKIRSKGIKVIPIVSSVRAAEMIFRMWEKIYNDVPDGLVFEGPKAGGHLGFSPDQLELPEFQLEAVVPGLVQSMKIYQEKYHREIPVIAAGGIFSGEDIHKALELGASAVQMGTRFAATWECDAEEAFKQALVDCRPEDIGLIKSPVGMPGRAIRNDFILASEEGTRHSFKCPAQCLSSCKAQDASYCISIALDQARQGKMHRGFVFSGTNGHRIKSILSVEELVTELKVDYSRVHQEYLEESLEGFASSILGWVKDYRNLSKERGLKLGDGLRTPLGLGDSAVRKALTERYEVLCSKLKKLKIQLHGLTQNP